MSRIISPCNGKEKCWRHSTGCAKIVFTPQEEYALRQKRKARRRQLWHIVLEHYRVFEKWWGDPIPRRYHIQVVLLLEKLRDDMETWQSINESQKRERKEIKFNIEEHAG